MSRALSFALTLTLLLSASPLLAAETPQARSSAVVQALRAARQQRSAPRASVVLASQRQRVQIQVGARKGQLTQQKQLVFDGKRAFIDISTRSDVLPGTPSDSRVAVPTGKLLGWWGRLQIKTHFPELTAAQIKARLGVR